MATKSFPRTLQEAVIYFSDPDTCLAELVKWRWQGGPVSCPTCGSQQVSFIATRRVWECKEKHALRQFSIKVGTIMEDSAIKLDKWLLAMWLIPNAKNGISSYELHRAIGELKLNGVILLSNIRGRPLTTPAYRPFFEEANRMKLCILLHPMLPANAEPFGEYVLGPLVGFPFDTTLAVARMCFDGMLRDRPDIRWIVGHLGGAIPYLMERLDNGFRDFAECRAKIDALPSTYLKKLYYDTVTFSPYTLSMARDLVGTSHMVMGSDYPHLLGSIDRAVSSIEALAIPDEEKQRIFSGTALSILNNV